MIRLEIRSIFSHVLTRGVSMRSHTSIGCADDERSQCVVSLQSVRDLGNEDCPHCDGTGTIGGNDTIYHFGSFKSSRDFGLQCSSQPPFLFCPVCRGNSLLNAGYGQDLDRN